MQETSVKTHHPLKKTPVAARRLAVPQWPSFRGTSQYVGTSPTARVAVYVDPTLGQQGMQNARDLLDDADRIAAANDGLFGTSGRPVSVIVFPLGGGTD